MLRAHRHEVFAAVVRRSGDRSLDRLLGPRALGLLFREMCARFDPDAAAGFAGDIVYELESEGEARVWTVSVAADRATAARGAAREPALRLRASVADFARIAAGELDAGDALFAGRLDVWGDAALAARLGEMFGQSGLLAR